MASAWEGTWVTSNDDGFGDPPSNVPDWHEAWPDESRMGRSASGFPRTPDDHPSGIPGANLPSPGDGDGDYDDYYE